MKEVLFRTRYIEEQGIWEFVVDNVTYYITTEVFDEVVAYFQKNKEKVMFAFKDISGLGATIKISNRVTVAKVREYLELVQADFRREL